MDGSKLKREGVHTKPVKHSLCNGEEKKQLQQETGVTGRGARFCGSDDSSILVKHTAEKRGLTCAGRSCEGDDSPVSVIYAATKHFMQPSHASSACTSMEHPLHHLKIISPPGFFHFNTRSLPSNSSQEPYAGSMSERVQEAFSKSHETKTECNLDWSNIKSAAQFCKAEESKLWRPNIYAKIRRNMEWLNLQEEPPPKENGIAQVYVHSHTSASTSPDDDEADPGFSIHSTRDPDEESVIDFFPSSNRPSSAMQLRRRSYDRVNELEKGKYDPKEEDVKRVSVKSRKGMKRMSGGAAAAEEEVEGTGLITRVLSCSSKWDEAERWLTCRGSPPPPPLLVTNDHLHFNTLPKAGALPQLVQLATAQDKHVSEKCNEPKGRISTGSHGGTGATREAGTEVGLESMRDMATQSTPTDWSRCDSPETANNSTGAEKMAYSSTTAPEKGASASPPRHNTPARRSVSCTKQSATKHSPQGALGKLNLLELENCHLDKLKLARDLPLGTSTTWQLYPDDDEIDHSLKLLEQKSENAKNHQHAKVNMLEARVSAWEDVERAKNIAKFKRDEAKIEAWESLQRAEADAELQKLEVKLEKLRFEGRNKIMGRLASAQKRAQEMRGAAEAHKAEQLARVGMRANHIRKSGHLPSSTFNVVCSLTTKIKPTSNLSFS